jgi:hypothetical protein
MPRQALWRTFDKAKRCHLNEPMNRVSQKMRPTIDSLQSMRPPKSPKTLGNQSKPGLLAT